MPLNNIPWSDASARPLRIEFSIPGFFKIPLAKIQTEPAGRRTEDSGTGRVYFIFNGQIVAVAKEVG